MQEELHTPQGPRETKGILAQCHLQAPSLQDPLLRNSLPGPLSTHEDPRRSGHIMTSIPISQTWKLKLREAKEAAWHQTRNSWRNRCLACKLFPILL